VERQYLAVLSEIVSLADWREVVQAALQAAKKGDSRARDWLARHLLGEQPLALTDLAADEAVGVGRERDILERLVDRQEVRDDLEWSSAHQVKEARKMLKKFAMQQDQAPTGTEPA
jgi:hypothetical protein